MRIAQWSPASGSCSRIDLGSSTIRFRYSKVLCGHVGSLCKGTEVSDDECVEGCGIQGRGGTL